MADDSNLEEMMNAALGAADTDDEVQNGSSDKHVGEEKPVVKKKEPKPVQKPVVEREKPVVEDESTQESVANDSFAGNYQSNHSVAEQIEKDNKSEPEKIVEGPKKVEPKQVVKAPTTEDTRQAEFIAKILKMSDLYRGFDDKTKVLASKFFSVKNEEDILALSLKQEPITLDALTSLENVHKAKDVDKAFYLVSLKDALLKEIGRLVKVFTDVDIKFTDHITYCRKLEAELRKMDDTFISQVHSLLTLLKLA